MKIGDHVQLDDLWRGYVITPPADLVPRLCMKGEVAVCVAWEHGGITITEITDLRRID